MVDFIETDMRKSLRAKGFEFYDVPGNHSYGVRNFDHDSCTVETEIVPQCEVIKIHCRLFFPGKQPILVKLEEIASLLNGPYLSFPPPVSGHWNCGMSDEGYSVLRLAYSWEVNAEIRMHLDEKIVSDFCDNLASRMERYCFAVAQIAALLIDEGDEVDPEYVSRIIDEYFCLIVHDVVHEA